MDLPNHQPRLRVQGSLFLSGFLQSCLAQNVTFFVGARPAGATLEHDLSK